MIKKTDIVQKATNQKIKRTSRSVAALTRQSHWRRPLMQNVEAVGKGNKGQNNLTLYKVNMLYLQALKALRLLKI